MIENLHILCSFVNIYPDFIELYRPLLPMDSDEIFLEIDRLAQLLETRYSHQKWPFEDLPPSTLDPETPERILRDIHQTTQRSSANTFSVLLTETYHALAHNVALISNEPQLEYDRDHSAHRNALTFMTLLLLGRSAKLSVEGNLMNVLLSPHVAFHLQTPPPGVYEERIEDNPGFDSEQLSMLISEYPRHSLSPITPTRFITPHMFQRFVENIKSMDEKSFYLLCFFSLSLLMKTEDEYLDPAMYVSRLKEICPLGQQLGLEASTILITLARNYVGSIDTLSGSLARNSKVSFDPHGLDTYFDQQRIPKFLHSEGNFASAICSFFKAYNPRLHDGNCGVNSFLMGIHGSEAYSGSDGMERLRADISGFRTSIVSYAQEHRAELAAKYPKRDGESRDEVTEVIERYNDARQREWTGSIVWDIAAQIYGQTIKVYSLVGSSFSVDSNGEIEPAGVFAPQRPSQAPPVNLMLFGDVHYCLLAPRV